MLLEKAAIYMKSGRLTEALQVLEKVLAMDPNNADALMYRSTIYVSSGRNLDQAIHDLQLLRDRAPDSTNVRSELAEADLQKGDEDGAIRELETVVRMQPTKREAILRLAQLYANSSPPRWLDVEQGLARARKQPALANDVGIILAQTQMWLKRNQSSRAADSIAEAKQIAPENPTVLQVYCQVLLQGKQYRQVLDQTDSLVQSKQAPWWVYQFRGQAQRGLDDKQAALDEFSTGLDVAGKAGDDSAISTLVQTIANEIGIDQAKARILPRAQKGDHRWMMMMGYLSQLQGNTPDAIDWNEKVLADSTSTPQELDTARRAVGLLYLSLTPPNTTKAIDAFRKELDRNPNDVAALNNLACAMILPNSGYSAKDALEFSTRAFNLTDQAGQTDPMIDDTQGYILVLSGRADEGINLLQKALDRKTFPDVLYHMGEAYLALQPAQPAEAEKALDRAMALIDAQSKDSQTIDMELKSKIQDAQARARAAAPTTQKSST
jgi:tetratricopeptide (TPR) repeat protein